MQNPSRHCRNQIFSGKCILLHGRICRAYFNLMISEARMAVEKETVKRYDTIFNIINALTISGIKPGSDSSLAKAELSKSRITYNQIKEQAKNYREEISYLTGITPDRIVPTGPDVYRQKKKYFVRADMIQ